MSQAKRIKKDVDQEESQVLNSLLDHLSKKYNISKDLILSSIPDAKKFDYDLKIYKINPQEIEDEIEAFKFNQTKDLITADEIFSIIKDIMANKNKEEKKLGNQTGKNKNISYQNAPAKKNNITINEKINVKYNTTVVYNEGGVEMEKQFNIMNPLLDVGNNFHLIEPYDLIPKDALIQKNGYQRYFSEIKDKFLRENEQYKDDKKPFDVFVLFLAFDVIDQKPTYDDLVGIDPLDDFKKYILKINTNSDNIFLVSGQIAYIEGNLVDNGKTIEVSKLKNIYEINEYSIPYKDVLQFYEKSSEPFAIYYMNGPYFSKDSKDFSVFNNVLKNVAFKNPHFFIINGPFFSTENEKVKWGELDTEEGMKDIIKKINDEFIKTRTKILICPGISDNENFYPLPQPPFDKINSSFIVNKGNPEIIFISNPQIFPLNEAYIGVANFDVIKDIIVNSVHSSDINTVDKACEMILYQKNFYPILPNTTVQKYENNQERVTTVDLSQYNYLNFDKIETNPDIILTNSAMKPFAKKIHGTVFVNCGSFLKGKNYGEIAKITLHSPSQEITDINKRLKVEFIKINANLDTNNNKK